MAFSHLIPYAQEKRLTEKQNPVLRNKISLLDINVEVVRILVIFQDRPMFSHTIEKVSARAFH